MIATLRNMRLAQLSAWLNVFAYSPTTGERYSAHPGDYWDNDPDTALLDADGEPMLLARAVTRIEYFSPSDTTTV